MSQFVLRFAAATLLTLVPLGASAETDGALAIAVGEKTVTISNVTHGGTVVLFTCARTSRNGRTHFERTAFMIRDEDNDGIVQYLPERAVPLRSVWIAVDYQTGSSAAGADPRFPLHSNEIAASGFRKDAEEGLAALVQDIPRLVLLVVRPGTGAWLLAARDGAEGDVDGTKNARVTLAFGSARDIAGKMAAPKHLKHGDVVAAVTPGHLDVYLTRIAK